jgi:hypothetical protein
MASQKQFWGYGSKQTWISLLEHARNEITESGNPEMSGMRKKTWTFSSLVWLGITMTSMPLITVPLTITAAQAQNFPAEVREGYQLLQRGWVKDAITTFQQAV